MSTDTLDTLRRAVRACAFVDAAFRVAGQWLPDASRCPLWLSYQGMCHVDLVARLDHLEFGEDCIAAAVFLVPAWFADPPGLWAVRVQRDADGHQWLVCWLGESMAAL